MDRREWVIGIVSVAAVAALLTYGNLMMEVVFRALGI